MELNINQLKRIEIMKKILNEIDDTYILKGGTALFLYYGLDRFAEDIDLDSKTNNLNVLRNLKKIVQEENWKINIKKDTETTFRIMIDYNDENEYGN